MKKNLFLRFLDVVEPAALLVIGGSWLAASMGVSVIHPGTGKAVSVVNLLAPARVRTQRASPPPYSFARFCRCEL